MRELNPTFIKLILDPSLLYRLTMINTNIVRVVIHFSIIKNVSSSEPIRRMWSAYSFRNIYTMDQNGRVRGGGFEEYHL